MKNKINWTITHLFIYLFVLVLFSPDTANAQGGITCTGCTRTYTSNTGTVTVNPSDTVCLNAPNFIGNIVLNGGLLKVCGTAAPSNVSYNNGNNQASIINYNSLTLKDFSASPNVVLINNSVLRFPNNLNLQGTLVNYQYAEVNGDLNVNSGSLNNFGFLQVRGSLNNNSQVHNNGTIDLRGNLTNNSSGRFVNSQFLYVTGNFTNNGSFVNGYRMYVSGLTQLNSNGVLYLGEGSLLSTQSLGVDGQIQGTTASCSSIRVSNRTIINSNAVVSGIVDICDANGIEVNNGRVVPPATTNCSCTVSAAARTSAVVNESAAEEKSIIAYPSPFTHSLRIEYSIKESSAVTLSLYNSSGEKVKDIILNELQGAGDHVANFNGEDLDSGVYIYVLQTAKEYKSGKVVKK